MSHYPILGRDDLDSEQRAMWDTLTLGPRGFYTGGSEAKRLPDLYNAWLQFPPLGEAMLKLGDAIRHATELSGRHRELIVLTTSAVLGARVEFDFHIPFALAEGLPMEMVEAIGEGRAPAFADDDAGRSDRIVHQANIQLLRTATLTAETREEAAALLGFRGLTQLIAAVTLYVVTAYTTNVARVRLAEDFSADPDKLRDFFTGRLEDGEDRG